MPGLTGGELAKQVAALRPDIPIILCTGFSEMVSGKQPAEMGISAFVIKPYVITHLAKTIRKVLAQR
jgi:CheY-like chemotaxis protein